MAGFKNISIRSKLIVIQVTTAFIAILTCCVFYLYSSIKNFKAFEMRNKHSIAQVVGVNLVSPLLFNDPEATGKILFNLKNNPNILTATVYDKKGRKFADYPGNAATPASLPVHKKKDPDEEKLLSKNFSITYTVFDGKEPIGTLLLRGELKEMNTIIFKYVRGAVLILIFGVLLSIGISVLLQRSISSPVIGLARTAQRIADKADYSIRAVKLGNDEIGAFTDSFNEMVLKIENQNKSLSEFGARLGAQNRALQHIVSTNINIQTDNLKKAINEILETAADTMRVERVNVWLYDEEKTKIRCIDLYEKSKALHSEGLVLYAKDYPAYFLALESNRVINADNAKEDTRTSEFSESYLKPLGITSMLDASIRKGGRSVGVICFEQVGPMRLWTLDEQLFAGAIADSIAILLESAERISAERSLREKEEQLSSIYDTVGDLLFSLSVEKDGRYKFTSVNKAFETTTGLGYNQVIGKYIDEVIPQPFLNGTLQKYKEAITGKKIVRFEEISNYPSGKLIGEVSIAPLLDEEGNCDTLVGSVHDITERKNIEQRMRNLNNELEEKVRARTADLVKAQESLRLSEAKYRKIVEEAGDVVYSTNAVGYFTYINPIVKKLTGFNETELMGKHFLDIIDPEWKSQVGRFYKDQFRKRIQETTFAFPIITKTGEKKWVEQIVTQQKSDGRVVGHHAIVRDITMRKKAEDVLKEYEYFFNNSHDLVCIANFKGYFEILNPNFQKVLGYTEKELLEVPFIDFVHPDDKELTRKIMDKLVLGIEAFNFINRFRKKDGSYVWFDWNSTPDISKGKMYAAARDITEKKKAEEQLLEKASLLQATFDSSIGGILVVNKKGKIVVINKRFQALWKIPDEIIATRDDDKALDFVIGQLKEPEKFLDKVKELYNQPEKESFDILEFRDGRVFERYSMPQRLSGEVVGRVWNFIDVTEKKKADEALKSSEHFLDSVVENIPNMIFVKDAKNLRFVRFNKAGEDLLGYKRMELMGKNDHDLFPKTEADFFTNKDKKILESGELLQIEEEPIHTRFKGERILETKKIPILDPYGKPLYLLGISNDITAQKKMLTELDKKTKELQRSNTELEQFAYVASHDLQEPLRTIANYVGLLEESYSESKDEEVKEFFKFITSASNRMQTLIRDLLEFSRVGRNPVFDKVDCNKILKEVLDEMNTAIQESGAKITAPLLPVVKGIEIELKRLFQNLISNSIKFRKKNVAPEITIGVTEKEEEFIFSVSDNGIGIDEKFKSKLFIIFQRLPNAREYPGTGIGLATAKKIVNLHNGKIWIESKLNEGSTFYFTIHK